MTECAAVTMVYKSYSFLEKWVDYYGSQFGHTNLYVISHGGDPEHSRIAQGCNLIVVPRDGLDANFDLSRWQFLSKLSSGLLSFYKRVICVDCDEFIVIDPDCGTRLSDYLCAQDADYIAPLGFHLLPPSLDGWSLDWSKPVLRQMLRAMPDSRYSKPSIIGKDAVFLPGGHGLVDSGFQLDPKLMMFHLKYGDAIRFKALAREVADELRRSGTVSGDAVISSAWRFGPRREHKLVSSWMAMPDTEQDDPFSHYYNIHMRRVAVDPETGTTQFRQLRAFANPVRLPDRFADLL